MSIPKIISKRLYFLGVLVSLILVSACDENVSICDNAPPQLSHQEKVRFCKGDLSGVLASATNPIGGGEVCNFDEAGDYIALPESEGGSCDKNQLAQEMKQKIMQSTSAGGNKNNISASVIEIDPSGQQVGEPILDINGNQFEAVASSQKILTAYLLFKNKSKIESRFPLQMSREAAQVASKGENTGSFWDKYGTTNSVSFDELFKGVMSASSNGAAYTALELITRSKDEKAHAAEVNKLAEKFLGKNKKTNFSNSHGLDGYNFGGRRGNQREGVHGSTPLEMARMQARIMSDPEYLQYMSTVNPSGTPYHRKAGTTKRAGRNNVLVEEKRDGNCSGKRFAIFYGGGSGTNLNLNFFGGPQRRSTPKAIPQANRVPSFAGFKR